MGPRVGLMVSTLIGGGSSFFDISPVGLHDMKRTEQTTHDRRMNRFELRPPGLKPRRWLKALRPVMFRLAVMLALQVRLSLSGNRIVRRVQGRGTAVCAGLDH